MSEQELYNFLNVAGLTRAWAKIKAKIPTKTSDLSNDSDFQTGTDLAALQSTLEAEIPTNTSDLTNDSTYQTLSEVNALIAAALNGLTTIDYQFPEELPASGSKGVFYFIPHYVYQPVTPTGEENPVTEQWYEKVNGAYVLSEDTTVDSEKTYYSRSNKPSPNVYDEYVWTVKNSVGQWELLGTAGVPDMTEYVKRTDMVPITDAQIDAIFV